MIYNIWFIMNCQRQTWNLTNEIQIILYMFIILSGFLLLFTFFFFDKFVLSQWAWLFKTQTQYVLCVLWRGLSLLYCTVTWQACRHYGALSLSNFNSIELLDCKSDGQSWIFDGFWCPVICQVRFIFFWKTYELHM